MKPDLNSKINKFCSDLESKLTYGGQWELLAQEYRSLRDQVKNLVPSPEKEAANAKLIVYEGFFNQNETPKFKPPQYR